MWVDQLIGVWSLSWLWKALYSKCVAR